MSDILDKLLGVEKNAAVLVTEAEAEANRRKTAARMDANSRYTARLAEKTAELDSALEGARKGLTREKEEKNRAYAESLRKHAVDPAAFRREFLSGIETT